MYKTFLNSELRSGWGMRSPGGGRNQRSNDSPVYLLEHEVTVGGGPSGIEVIARFVHALPGTREGNGRSWRGGLVGLTLRRTRPAGKRIGDSGAPKCTFRLRAVAISPQSRSPMGGSSSPIVRPVALSVATTGVVPLVSVPEAVKEDVSPAAALPSPAAILPDASCTDSSITAATTPFGALPADANSAQTSAWLQAGRFHAFESTFASFSAADILRLSRDDLIQICGLPDGIRLFNALHSKAPTPRLTLYFSTEGSASLWRAVYLDTLTSNALASKLHSALSSPKEQLHSMLLLGPQGIHVLVTDELVVNMKDESMYTVEIIKDSASERYKLLLKPSSR